MNQEKNISPYVYGKGRNWKESIILLMGTSSFVIGILIYFTTKYFANILQISPAILFALFVVVFLGRYFRQNIKPAAGFAILSISTLIVLTILFVLMLVKPLPDMIEIGFSGGFMRYFAIIGISAICGGILFVLCYKFRL